jgi:hypothetical protein
MGRKQCCGTYGNDRRPGPEATGGGTLHQAVSFDDEYSGRIA